MQPRRVTALTGSLSIARAGRKIGYMVSPVVIAGFAALDAAIIGQLAYAVHSFEKRDDSRRKRR